jgi:hypothetical protein
LKIKEKSEWVNELSNELSYRRQQFASIHDLETSAI